MTRRKSRTEKNRRLHPLQGPLQEIEDEVSVKEDMSSFLASFLYQLEKSTSTPEEKRTVFTDILRVHNVHWDLSLRAKTEALLREYHQKEQQELESQLHQLLHRLRQQQLSSFYKVPKVPKVPKVRN